MYENNSETNFNDALILAVDRGNAFAARTSLMNGADPDYDRPIGRLGPSGRVLNLASEKGDVEMVNLLTEFGAKINGRDEDCGETALHVARNAETAVRLLELGANPNARDYEGRIPAHTAAFKMRSGVIDVLLPKSNMFAEDGKGFTPNSILKDSSERIGRDKVKNWFLRQLEAVEINRSQRMKAARG